MAIDTRPEFVIAVLGDSYASGEGCPDVHGHHSWGGDLVAAECAPGSPYGPCFSETWWSPDWFANRLAVFPQGDDPGWQDDARRCHRSSHGPGAHAAMQIAAHFQDVKIVVLDFACGGSKITDGLLLGWPGPEPSLGASNLPSQVEALEAYIGTSRTVDAIVLNIGGNDGRFADIIINCSFLDPVLDCQDQPLLDEIGELLNDETTPDFPDPRAPLRARYRVVDRVFRNAATGRRGVPGLVRARPREVYLTSMANPSHDAPSNNPSIRNPENYCDGTQTQDLDFSRIKFGEAVAIESLLAGINDAQRLAANRHGWIFIDTFPITRNHGVCADDASFFRTNKDALVIQGDEGLVAPLLGVGLISPGIGHQNEVGYAARADLIGKAVGEQVRMRFRAPTLTLSSIEVGTATKRMVAGRPSLGNTTRVTFQWMDPSPLHRPETRWELEILPIPNGNPRSVFSDGNGELDETQLGSNRLLTWRVSESGEFTARVRGCRTTPTGSYCGPFSNALTVATVVPDTPVGFERLRFVAPGANENKIGVKWTPGPTTPTSVQYEVITGPWGGIPCPQGRFFPPGATCGFGMVSATISTTTSTTFVRDSPAPSKEVFQVRACSLAGCSPYTEPLVIERFGIIGPVNQMSPIPRTPTDLPSRDDPGRPSPP